tara:strand:- start:81 stop:263 length:183 start_codon:yes stop_codon:yes gene_type:complete
MNLKELRVKLFNWRAIRNMTEEEKEIIEDIRYKLEMEFGLLEYEVDIRIKDFIVENGWHK